MNDLSQDKLRFILESAILAPSADNQHRVRFRIEQNTLNVFFTEETLPASGGYRRVLVMMSLGALVENLSIAASRFNMQTETALFPDSGQANLLLQIHLHPEHATNDPLWQYIPLRHTNRRVFFRGPKLDKDEKVQLGAALHAYPDNRLIWLDESADRNSVLRLMRLAETERFRTRELHEELFSAIRFEVGWQKSCPEGLPPAALAVEPLLRPAFALLRHWPIMSFLNLFGMHYYMGWRACDLPCRLAPDLGILAVKKTDDQQVFNTGRVFQRVWLTATSQGRVLQPMPASAIFALEGSVLEGVPAKTQHNLAEGWKSALGEDIPMILFRIGKAKPLPMVTGRQVIDHYLEQE